MKLQTTPSQINEISHYDATSLTIEKRSYSQSIIITSAKVTVIKKNIVNLNSLSIIDLSLEQNIELLIIGGHKITPINMPYELQKKLSKIKISIELMSLGAACRTFNILQSEARNVACLIVF